MWKSCLLMYCLLLAVTCDEKYTSKYDNVDIKEVLHNRRLFLGYVNCLFERGKCTPDAKEVKDNMREVFASGCDKCTDRQKLISKEVINHMIENEHDIWIEFITKYDPEGTWRKKYADRIKLMGINLPKED